MAKKKKEEEREIEAQLEFVDTTVLEANGVYSECVRIMKDEPSPWVLPSDVYMSHPFGTCQMRLELYYDGSVVITRYGSTEKDAGANFDLQMLNAWCTSNGWKRPSPSSDIVKDAVAFWKHMWLVHMVDSKFLEQRYGARPGDSDNVK